MKKFIVLFIFTIGMLVMWPPGGQVQANNSDQVSFAIDHQSVAPAAMLQDNAFGLRIENMNSQIVAVCREGGGVEVQVLNLVTQPTYLIEMKRMTIDFNRYSNQVFRICRDSSIDINRNYTRLQNDNIFVQLTNHRFARDGLTCRI